MIGFGIVTTLWAYEGWTNLNTVAGEMKNVKKDLPISLIASIILVTSIYVLFIIALYRLIPLATLSSISEDANLPMIAMMSKFGNIGMTIVLVSVMISIVGALNGSIMVFPRIYYAMAQDGTFLKPFAQVHHKYKTPIISLIASSAMAVLLLIF